MGSRLHGYLLSVTRLRFASIDSYFHMKSHIDVAGLPLDAQTHAQCAHGTRVDINYNEK